MTVIHFLAEPRIWRMRAARLVAQCLHRPRLADPDRSAIGPRRCRHGDRRHAARLRRPARAAPPAARSRRRDGCRVASSTRHLTGACVLLPAPRAAGIAGSLAASGRRLRSIHAAPSRFVPPFPLCVRDRPARRPRHAVAFLSDRRKPALRRRTDDVESSRARRFPLDGEELEGLDAREPCRPSHPAPRTRHPAPHPAPGTLHPAPLPS